MTDKKTIREKFGPYFLVFYVLTFVGFFIFPKQLASNFYFIIFYLLVSIIFLFILERFKRKNSKEKN
jgi:hypothetical protein